MLAGLTHQCLSICKSLFRQEVFSFNFDVEWLRNIRDDDVYQFANAKHDML